jgi:hypothetical protein
MTGKTAVERIGSAVVATYVPRESKEPKGGLRGKLTPEMIPDLAEFPGKAENSISKNGVGFPPWKSAFGESLRVAVEPGGHGQGEDLGGSPERMDNRVVLK